MLGLHAEVFAQPVKVNALRVGCTDHQTWESYAYRYFSTVLSQLSRCVKMAIRMGGIDPAVAPPRAA